MSDRGDISDLYRVAQDDEVDTLDELRLRAGHVWRCSTCGDLNAIEDECPCGAWQGTVQDLADALRQVEDHGFGHCVDWDSIIESAARHLLHQIEPDPLKRLPSVPLDWPVQPLNALDIAAAGRDVATCGTCLRSWNDGISTSMTPAPSARCPFEAFH